MSKKQYRKFLPSQVKGYVIDDEGNLSIDFGDNKKDLFVNKDNLDNTEGVDDKLDKVTLDPQTVAGEVEFLQSIIVPPSTVFLGAGGSRLSSAARSLDFIDAFNQQHIESGYTFDASGNTNPQYEDFDPEITVTVNPISGITLSDPQELSFPTTAADTFTKSFIIIPKTSGQLRVQSWSGGDDTGAVLVDNMFTIVPGDIDTEVTLVLPNPQMYFLGDSFFTRFSGVQLSGGIQIVSANPYGVGFNAETKPFLKSTLHLITMKDIIVEGDDISKLNNDAGYISSLVGQDHSDLTFDDGTNPHSTTKSDVGLSNADNTSDLNKPISTATQTALDDKEDTINKGVANGYAPTDGSNRIPESFLPISTVVYKGTFGSGGSTTGGDLPSSGNTTGDKYICDTNGYVSTEAGLTFDSGDMALYDGSGWHKVDNNESVSSVFGRLGVITAQSGDYNADQISETVSNKIMTAAERTNLGNQSNTNTGDQDLSGLALKKQCT